MKFVLSLLLCGCVFLASAQKFSDVYKSGDKLYVCSAEGISLRPTPDTKSVKIMVVQYGTPVTVKTDPNPRVTFVSTGVPGTWVKVTALGKEGYVFDGFLSRFKPMSLPTDPNGRNLEEIIDYLTSLSKVQSRKTWESGAATPQPEECDYCGLYDRIGFMNGGKYEQRAYEGGSMVDISFPSDIMTFQETYLLARMIYNEFFKTPCPYNEGDMKCLFENDENIMLKISKEGGRSAVQWAHAD